MGSHNYHANTGSNVGILKIRWRFRKVFERKVREALTQHKTSGGRKRQRRDSVSGATPKRAKIAPEQLRRSNPSEDDHASTSSKSSKWSGGSKTKKGFKVKMGVRYQTVVSQKAPSPWKTGRYRRSSTSSSAPSDGSGRRANLASQGEVRVAVPNDQDVLRISPTNRRLAWEARDPLVRSEPVKHERDAAA